MLCPLGFLIFPTLCLSAVSGGRRLSAPLRTPPQAGEGSPCRQASPGPRLGSALIPGQTQLRDRRAAYDRRRPPASFTADRTKAQRVDVIFTKSHGKWEAEKQDLALLAATVTLFLKVPQSLPTQHQSSSELWKLELRGYASRQLRVKAHHIRLGRRGQAEAGVPTTPARRGRAPCASSRERRQPAMHPVTGLGRIWTQPSTEGRGNGPLKTQEGVRGESPGPGTRPTRLLVQLRRLEPGHPTPPPSSLFAVLLFLAQVQGQRCWSSQPWTLNLEYSNQRGRGTPLASCARGSV